MAMRSLGHPHRLALLVMLLSAASPASTDTSLSPMQDQQPSSPPSPGQPPATGPGRAVTTGPVATAGTDGLTLRQCHGVIDRQICANFAGTAAWCGEPDVASLCPGLCGCSYSPVDPAVTANASSTSGGGKPVRVVPTAVVSPNTTPARPEHDPATSGTGPSGAVAEQRPYSLSECGCRFPFRHRGEVYDSCTSYGMTRHWCATQVDAAGEFVFLKERRDSWRYCDEACAPTAAALTTNPTRPPTAVAEPASIAAAAAASSTSSSPPVVTAAVVSSTVDTTFTAATFPITAEIPDSISDCGCVFPFTYAGVTHNTCTDADDPRLWCATSVDDSGFFNVRSGDWRFCDSPCPPRPTVATVGHVRPTRPPDDGPVWPVPPPPTATSITSTSTQEPPPILRGPTGTGHPDQGDDAASSEKDSEDLDGQSLAQMSVLAVFAVLGLLGLVWMLIVAVAKCTAAKRQHALTGGGWGTQISTGSTGTDASQNTCGAPRSKIFRNISESLYEKSAERARAPGQHRHKQQPRAHKVACHRSASQEMEGEYFYATPTPDHGVSSFDSGGGRDADPVYSHAHQEAKAGRPRLCEDRHDHPDLPPPLHASRQLPQQSNRSVTFVDANPRYVQQPPPASKVRGGHRQFSDTSSADGGYQNFNNDGSFMAAPLRGRQLAEIQGYKF